MRAPPPGLNGTGASDHQDLGCFCMRGAWRGPHPSMGPMCTGGADAMRKGRGTEERLGKLGSCQASPQRQGRAWGSRIRVGWAGGQQRRSELRGGEGGGPWWAPHRLHLQASAGIRQVSPLHTLSSGKSLGFSRASVASQMACEAGPRERQLAWAGSRGDRWGGGEEGRQGRGRQGGGGRGRGQACCRPGLETWECPGCHGPGAGEAKFHNPGASHHGGLLSPRSRDQSLRSRCWQFSSFGGRRWSSLSSGCGRC